MMDNYNFGFVAPAIIKSWGISLAQVGQVNSLFFVGMFLGGLLGGYLSDRIGRRKSLLFSLLVFSVFSIANGLVGSFLPFLVSRFCTGIGVASLVIVAVPYLAEMLPKETRGKWQALSIGLGCVAIPFLGIACKLILPLGPEAWRLIYISGGLGLVAFLFGIFWLKESPRWLVSKGRIAEAEKILEEIVGHRIELSVTESTPVKKENFGRVLLAMFDRRNARNSLVLMSIFMLAYPAAFIFINWAPTMFSTKGFPLKDVLLLTMLMSFGLAAGPFLATYVSDKGGRKGPIAANFRRGGGTGAGVREPGVESPHHRRRDPDRLPAAGQFRDHPRLPERAVSDAHAEHGDRHHLQRRAPLHRGWSTPSSRS